MADANGWGRAASLLHLRDALREGAQDCGRAETIPAIFTALRSRYGLTPREARARISALRRDSQTSLQEHATEVKTLQQEHATLQQEHATEMKKVKQRLDLLEKQTSE